MQKHRYSREEKIRPATAHHVGEGDPAGITCGWDPFRVHHITTEGNHFQCWRAKKIIPSPGKKVPAEGAKIQ